MENQKGLFLISIVLKNDDKSLLWFAAVKGIFCQRNILSNKFFLNIQQGFCALERSCNEREAAMRKKL